MVRQCRFIFSNGSAGRWMDLDAVSVLDLNWAYHNLTENQGEIINIEYRRKG